jgi:formylglycine-generating enzyme required for sulfatase activity
LDEQGRDSLEWAPHQVTITRDFYIGKYEITQAQWQAVMNTNPSRNPGKPDHPVENVTWNDCQEFVDALNLLGQGTYRLPTEAEWEYACRAGTTTRFYFGDVLECADEGKVYCEEMDKYMWWYGNNIYDGNLYNVNKNGTKEVGLKTPNAWNLFDMSGGVREWCSDWWDDPYDRGEIVDPMGSTNEKYKIVKNSSYSNDAKDSRSAFRYRYTPSLKSLDMGFRVVRNP